jgi:hypothetical protein
MSLGMLLLPVILTYSVLSIKCIMSAKEQKHVKSDMEKVQTLDEQGDVIVVSEPLTTDEDNRLLRRSDT